MSQGATAATRVGQAMVTGHIHTLVIEYFIVWNSIVLLLYPSGADQRKTFARCAPFVD